MSSFLLHGASTVFEEEDDPVLSINAHRWLFGHIPQAGRETGLGKEIVAIFSDVSSKSASSSPTSLQGTGEKSCDCRQHDSFPILAHSKDNRSSKGRNTHLS